MGIVYYCSYIERGCSRSWEVCMWLNYPKLPNRNFLLVVDFINVDTGTQGETKALNKPFHLFCYEIFLFGSRFPGRIPRTHWETRMFQLKSQMTPSSFPRNPKGPQHLSSCLTGIFMSRGHLYVSLVWSLYSLWFSMDYSLVKWYLISGWVLWLSRLYKMS